MNQDSNRRSGRRQGGEDRRIGYGEGRAAKRSPAYRKGRSARRSQDRPYASGGPSFKARPYSKDSSGFKGRPYSKDRFDSKARPYSKDHSDFKDRPYSKNRSDFKARPYPGDRKNNPAPLDEENFDLLDDLADDLVENSASAPEERENLRFEDELVFGRNAVREAVQAGLSLNKIYVAEGEEGGLGGDRRLKDIYQEAVEKGYLVQLVPKAKLDRMCAGHQGKHQGIAAMASPITYADPYDVLKTVISEKKQITVILLDQIEDSYNLASMIRSAECAGADLIVMPERRSVAVNYLVARESAGALAHVPVARVGNLRHFMKTLKDQGFWIYGLDMEGTVNYRHEKYPDRVAIVTGNEGKGLRPSTLQDCDFILSIPMQGKINSLNAAVATALVLFEIAGSRADARQAQGEGTRPAQGVGTN